MSPFFKFVVFAGLMATQSLPVFAGDNDDLGKIFSACMEHSGGVTASTIGCMGAETDRQDVRLNKAYKDVLVGLAPKRKKQLLVAQRLWLKYRKANCDFYYDPDGGTKARLKANECFMSATAARAKELEGFKRHE